MGRPRLAPLPGEVGETAGRLEAWRKARKSGSRMPADLWAEIAALGRRLGVNRICKTLGLSYSDLKKHVGDDQSLCRLSESVKPTFVELDGGCFLGGQQTGPMVELFNPDGARMVLKFPDGSPVNFLSLVDCFLRPHR